MRIVLVCSTCQNRIPQTGRLKQHHLFSHSSRSWKFKIKVSVRMVSPEASIFGLQMATLMISCNLNYLLKDPIYHYSHIGVRSSMHEIWADTIHFMTLYPLDFQNSCSHIQNTFTLFLTSPAS